MNMSVRCTIRCCIAIIVFLGISCRVLAHNQTGSVSIVVDKSGKEVFRFIQEAVISLPLPERNHPNAQFYLINCQFAENMASENIYLVPSTRRSSPVAPAALYVSSAIKRNALN